MATSSAISKSTLQINYKTGQNANGKDVIKSDKFPKLNSAVTNDDIYAVAAALGTLLIYPVVSIERVDNNVITNQ
ncbi:DUF1659 domain-containing protein [Clostridium akagii]|uniref:DUF1659 domain-containing protein n=1 Tax=Clostridium akagii TaxID=91623 RepID=UPI00047C2EAD|nr:DUF1659 domain-containing protein [Clostridium akagii]